MRTALEIFPRVGVAVAVAGGSCRQVGNFSQLGQSALPMGGWWCAGGGGDCVDTESTWVHASSLTLSC